MLYRKKFTNSIHRLDNKLLKTKKLFFKKSSYISITKYNIYIPSFWNFYLINLGIHKPTLLKLYSENLYFNLFLPTSTSQVNFSSWSSILGISCFKVNTNYSVWLKNALEILDLTNSYYFNKIKFRGKGYYIYKNSRSTITPQFGYAHRIYIYSFLNKVRFLGKTRVLVFGFSKQDVLTTLFNIKSKRPINIFTGRGVRFSQEIIYKKTGKVSSYR